MTSKNPISLTSFSQSSFNNNDSSTDYSTIIELKQPSWEALRKQVRQLESEIEQKLTSYSNLIAQVSKKKPGSSNGSQSNLTNDGLIESSSEVAELHLEELINKMNLEAVKNKSDLLKSVRDDISSYKSGASSETDYFLRERGKIENSNKMTDMIIEQAFETRDAIERDRAILLNSNSRIRNLKNYLRKKQYMNANDAYLRLFHWKCTLAYW
ncbi:16235_t:CDS:2 [Entrophospora sp. SA101]|nr:16235_t:CDS:2 [Entrophospora sp. SA101]